MILLDVANLKFLISIILVIVPGLPNCFFAFGSLTVLYIIGLMLSDGITAGCGVILLICLIIYLLMWLISLIFLRARKISNYFVGMISFAVLNMFDTICAVFSYIGGEPSVYKIINAFVSLAISVICIFLFKRKKTSAGDGKTDYRLVEGWI